MSTEEQNIDEEIRVQEEINRLHAKMLAPPSEDSLMGQALGGVAKALNVIPGVTRTAINQGAKAIQGKPFTPGADFNKAIRGEAPPSSEMYPALGPYWGFAADVVQDPTMLVLGPAGKLIAKGAGKVAPLFQKASVGMEAADKLHTTINPTLMKALREKFQKAGMWGGKVLSEAPSSSEMYPALRPHGGGAADVGQDLTTHVLGPAGKILGEGADKAAPLLQKASVGMEAADKLPTTLNPTFMESLREKLQKAGVWAGKVLSNGPAIEAAVQAPAQTAFTAGSEALARRALKGADKMVKGKPYLTPPSTTMLEAGGASLTREGLAAQWEKVLEQLNAKAADIELQMSNLGAQALPGVSLKAGFDAALEELSNIFGKAQARKMIRNIVDEAASSKVLSFNELVVKKQQYQAAAKAAYGAGGADAPTQAKIAAAMAKAAREQIEATVARVNPKTANVYHELNARIGGLIEAQPWANQLTNKPLFSPWDLAAAGAGWGASHGSPIGALKGWAAKKAYDVMVSPATQMLGAKALRLGAKVPESVHRQGYIHSQQPWGLLENRNLLNGETEK